MIAADDSRTTLEFDDHYVVAPAFKDWTDKPVANGTGRPVPEGFSYSSDTNTQWLKADALRRMIDDVQK